MSLVFKFSMQIDSFAYHMLVACCQTPALVHNSFSGFGTLSMQLIMGLVQMSISGHLQMIGLHQAVHSVMSS